MISRGPEIIENVAYVWERLGWELRRQTIKISKKRLLKTHTISCFLNNYVKEYTEDTLREKDKVFFLISVGVLIGTFTGVSKTVNSEKILENLRKLKDALMIC